MASRAGTNSNEGSAPATMTLKERFALLRRRKGDTEETKATGSVNQIMVVKKTLSSIPSPAKEIPPEALPPKPVVTTKVNPPVTQRDPLEAGRNLLRSLGVSDAAMRPISQSSAPLIFPPDSTSPQPTHTLPLRPLDAPKQASKSSNPEDTDIYKYSPLPDGNTIRILELLPGRGEEEIKIILKDYALAWNSQTFLKPNYTAFSYEWGLPEVRVPSSDGQYVFTATFLKRIFCGGKTIRVTWNLHSVLRQLRFPDASRLLWIDGICIDQRNREERGQQVTLMREVYASAAEVILWLGPEGENTLEAISLIPELAQIYRGVDFGSPPRHMTGMDTNQSIQHLHDKDKYGKAWLGLRDLFARPYFTRIWIIQEITVPRSATIQCGSHQCSWDDFQTAYGFVENSTLLDKVVGHPIPRATEEFRTYFSALASIKLFVERDKRLNQWRTLHNLLQNFRSHKVTDPRDRVYGMLGLLHDDSSKFSAIVPDYKKFIQRVYQDATERSIQETQSFILLDNLVNATYFNELPSLPTWIPDLTSGPERCGGIPFFSQFSNIISRRQPFQTPIFNGGTITTQAYIIDRVGSLHEPLTNPSIPPILLQLFWDYALERSPVYPSLSKHQVIFYTFNPKATFTPSFPPRIKISSFADFKNFCARSILDMFGLPQRLTGQERDLRSIAAATSGSKSDFSLLEEFPDDVRANISIPALMAKHAKVQFLYSCVGQGDGIVFYEQISTSTMLTEKTFGRQVFETISKGFLGLGPPAPHGELIGELRRGDLRIAGKEGAGVRSLDSVAILVGSQKLWILRPKGERGGKRCFSIVGDAYIYGISQGFDLEKELGTMEMITIV